MVDDFKQKRIFVTGGTGFLGGAVVSELRNRGAKVVMAPSSNEIDLLEADTTRTALLAAKADVVIHLAARVGGIGANMKKPADLYLHNLLLGTNVIEAARIAGVEKTVVVGTICSYPKHTPVPFKETSLWQGYPEETNAPYGIAKLALLVHLQANRAQYGQHGIYLMCTNLYGPGDKFHPSVSHVIPAVIRKCVHAVETGRQHIDVWGSGTATREFLYVNDAAKGIVAAAEHYQGSEPVNLGFEQEISISEVVEIIAELTGFAGEIRWDSSKPDGQPRRSVDSSRARELFNFHASTDFRKGLSQTIEWYRTHRLEAEARQN